MKHVMQPFGSNLCGQACVAMIAGITLEESVAAVRKRGKTYTRDLAEALGLYGYRVMLPMMIASRVSIPLIVSGPTIVRVLSPDGSRHFVVFYGNQVFDPELTEPISRAKYADFLLFRKRRLGGWAPVIR